MKQILDTAAYIWPAYTGREPRTRIFWPEGIGEWETVREAKGKFDGHRWPRKPLWGYVDEADPRVMEMQIEEAVSHGVNTFIYDFYRYDGRPFLEQCLRDGFLGARNNDKMKFYLMWANHDANYLWDRRLAPSEFGGTVLWRGSIGAEEFLSLGRYWIREYFARPNYYRVDGKPVLAIYDLANFLSGVGGYAEARRLMEQLDREAAQAGVGGIHWQLIYWASGCLPQSGVDAAATEDALVTALPFSSLTHYQFVHFTDVDRDYADVRADVLREWQRLSDTFRIPYFPHVSLGWDNNPRYPGPARGAVLRGNTPEAVRRMMFDAREYALSHHAPVVTINSWNEWTESSYLEPDDLYGYGYLDAVRDVFTE